MPSILNIVKKCEIQHYKGGEIVLAQGTRTESLLFLIEGSVEVVIDGVTVATACQPGAVFGDLSALMNVNHTATVRALKPCAFHIVKNAHEFIEESPFVTKFLCELLAYRLDAINQYLVAVKHQIDRPKSADMILFLESLMGRQVPPKEPPQVGDKNSV
jgi:CRP/FNR family cyclic AMP-dependent transcriptional regulator